MKVLKWIFGFVAVLLFVAIAGGWVFAQFYLEPYLKKQIETRGSAALGAPLTVDAVKVGLLPPLKVHILGLKTKLAQPAASIGAERVVVVAHIGTGITNPAAPLGRFEIYVERPVVSAILPKPAQTSASQTPGAEAPPLETKQDETAAGLAGNPLHGRREVAAEIHVSDATIDVKYEGMDRAVRMSPLNISLNVPSLTSAWTLALDAKNTVAWDGIKIELPVKTKAEFKYDGATLSVPDAQGDIGGLQFSARGAQTLKPAPAGQTLKPAPAGQWSLKIGIADLAKLPVPPSILPPGKFAGQIQADIGAKTVEGGAWAASGLLEVKQFRGESAFSFKDAKASGLVAADISARFEYGTTLKFPKLQASVNLDNAELAYSNVFAKPKAVPLNLTVDAAGDTRKIELRGLKLVFAQLNAQARGSIAPAEGASSKVNVDVTRTSLAGWEKYFPILAGAPVTGFVEVKADIDGDLRKPEELNFALSPLLLQDVKGRVQWTSADRTQSLAGPVEFDARVNVRAKGKVLMDASVSADAQLTNLMIKKKDTFEKRAGQPLRLELKAEKRGNVIELRPSTLDLGQSRFQVSGRVQEPQRPKLSLQLSSPKMMLKELGGMLPAARGLVPDGTGSFKGDLNGTFDFKLGVQGSPLRAKLKFNANIPRYVFKSAPAPAPAASGTAPAQAPSPAPAPQPLLPDWPVLRTSEITSNVRVDHFLFNDLPVRRIQAQTTLASGVLTGAVSAENVFGGSILLSGLRADLKQAQPDLNAATKFQNIDANAAMTWISKDWKALVRGNASGKVQALIPHPSRADFVARTKAEGDITLADAFVSTLQFDKMANDVIAKIPGVGEDKRLASKGVAADIRVSFAWEKSRALIRDFVFLTPENNQISARGTVDLQKNLDLSGTAYLATAPVKGSVREANSDASGRFTIPIQIKGNMLQPQASFAQASIEGIIKNTADYELNKAKSKAQAKLKEERKKLEGKAKNEIDKIGEKIKKDGLRGLFK